MGGHWSWEAVQEATEAVAHRASYWIAYLAAAGALDACLLAL
jgi:hypothetical protein